MRILLIKPPSSIHLVVPPIGLGYLAAYLKKHAPGVEVLFLDCLRDKIGFSEFEALLPSLNPDIVGITGFSMELPSMLKCGAIVKRWNPKIITCAGGPHASNSPDDLLSNGTIDYVFRGESEIAFCDFVGRIEAGLDPHDINNLAFMHAGEIRLNSVKHPQNLDELPFPDYELMQFEKYPKTYKMKYYPTGQIITSRGCPYLCNYCTAGAVSGKKFRYRTPKNIVSELKWLVGRYNIKEFQIWDDNFTLLKDRTRQFCELLEKAQVNLPWWCPNGLRTETLDEPLIAFMKKTGLYSIALGVESGSPRILKDMKKNLDLKKVKEIVRIGNKYGIRMEGFFILGYPTETRDDILQTIRFAKELPIKRASFSLFQPLVGSEIYKTLKEEGRLPRLNFSDTEYSNPSIVPLGMKNLQELKNMHRRAIVEFYMRPGVFFNFIKENMSIDQMKELFKMVKKQIFSI